MKRDLIFRLFPLSVALVCASFLGYGQEITKTQKDALELLYDQLDGQNWRGANDKPNLIKTLKANTKSPRITLHKGGGFGPELSLLDLSGNKLKGKLPDAFFLYNPDNYPEFPASWNKRPTVFRRDLRTFDLGHNSITEVSEQFMTLNGYAGPKNIFLDHNKLTKFHMNSDKKIVSGSGIGGWGISGVLDLSSNDITSITQDDLMKGLSDNAIGTYVTDVDISNNRFDFQSIKAFTYAVLFGANGARASWDDKYVITDITYAPQKKLGDKQDEVSLDNGAGHEMTFSLRDGGNAYSWLLNGKPVPASEGKTLKLLDFGPNQAGIYTCAVTNSGVPGLIIESVDFAVWAKKSGNQAPTALSISNDKAVATTPAFNIVGDLSGTDPDGDPLNFRLVDDENYPYNFSFRIKDGKTLVSSEELFERDFLTEYKIKVEAYDPYGGKFSKELTIKRVDLPAGAQLANEFKLSSFDVSENVDEGEEVGVLALNKYSLRWHTENRKINRIVERVDLLGQYNLSLPSGQMDNDLFAIKDGKIVTKSKFNYEQRKEYNVSVKASHKESAEVFTTQIFTIKITDANDAPSVVALSNNIIKDKDEAGKIVGTLLSSDEDPDDVRFTFSLAPGSPNNSAFAVSKQFLKTRKQLESGVYDLQVRAEDPQGAYVDQPLKVVVLETNDEGEVTKSTPEIMYIEDLALSAGTKSYVLKGYSTSDAKVQYSLVEGSDAVSVDGAKVTILAEGSAKIKAAVAETDLFLSAEKTFNVTVNPATVLTPTVITNFGNKVLPITEGTFGLSAYTNSDAKVRYEVSAGNDVISINGSLVTMVKAGNATIRAYVEASENYAATEATANIRVIADGEVFTTEILGFEDMIKNMGDEAFPLSAYSDSPAKVSYEIMSGADVAEIDGVKVKILAPGLVAIRAYVDALQNFSAAEKTVTLRVNTVTEIGKDGEITFYPNPVTDILKIKTEAGYNSEASVTVFGQDGKQLLSTPAVNSEGGEFSVDLSSLSPGIYRVRLTTDKGTLASTIVKK
ncbi:hypothetical protein FUAX_44050 (plasmid) [Fulvitalea axinellae]|uniref:Cadherin domain-containing protein n=1 Tax=Fulvitalea axinellae TaxID=1182444 RepID=A0AAU9CVC2_9BACT|nr:hypothetical protein FUAX_44050 [Fulvitalea axinellae]